MSRERASWESLLTLVQDNTTTKYHILYGPLDFFNHLCHGLIALQGLGASEDKLRHFITYYVERTEITPPIPDEIEDGGATPIEDIRGKKKCFYRLVDHYMNQLDNVHKGDLAALVRRELMRVSLSMGALALHGLIHMGHGFYVKNPRVVCEGLATIYAYYDGLRPTEPDNLSAPLGDPGDLSFLEVLNMVRCNEGIGEVMENPPEEVINDPRFENMDFENKFGILNFAKADELIDYVNRIQLPEFFHSQDASAENWDQLMKWVIDQAIHLYAASEKPNYFFFLHGVTSAWSLRQLLPAFATREAADTGSSTVGTAGPDSSTVGTAATDSSTSSTAGGDRNKIVRLYLCCVLMTYITQGRPALDLKHIASVSTEDTWDHLVAKALDGDREEHSLKLVNICHLLSQEEPCSPELDTLYRAAVKTVLSQPFEF